MTQKAPGKYFRKGITLAELCDSFPDDEAAERWFVESRWPDGLRCAHCDGENVAAKANHPSQPYHCGDCRKFFSAKTNTVMHGSNLGYRKWLIAIYILTTNLKGASSMSLHRAVGVTQKTAWHLAHRIREGWEDTGRVFDGPVEADETYIGGKEGNKRESKKLRAGRGAVGKTPVAGVKDRETNQIAAEVVKRTNKMTLQRFVRKHTDRMATVYTDEARAYMGLDRIHEVVKHSVGEYVRGSAHTNGMESFWAMLKRGYIGVYHQMSGKHLFRYVGEFAGRHNIRRRHTADQMSAIARGMVGRRLRYEDLIGPPHTRIDWRMESA